MTTDLNEAKDGGILRDRYGREQLIVVDKHAVPATSDIPIPSGYTDADGRRQVVIESLTGGTLQSADLGPSSGTDDRATIQAKLDRGGYWKGRPGATYKLGGPLIIGADTILDMTGCTISLNAGIGGNMLTNTALAAARTVIDGAITTGTATLTSATASFSAADVGKRVYVVGADASGTRRLETTIQSFTNSTTVVLAANAGATVTNAWVTIGTRDANIRLIGGNWDRGANGTGGSFGYMANSIRLRRVDNLTVEGLEGASTAGKYLLNPGDVWDFRITGVHGRDVFSDVVHVNGPARHGTIRDTSADHAGDDIVSVTAGDFEVFASMADTWGDLDNILIDGVKAVHGEQRGVLVAAGTKNPSGVNQALNVRDVTVRNVQGRLEGGAVWVGGDTADSSLRGGTYTSVTVDGAKVRGNIANYNADIQIHEGTFDDVTILNVTTDAKALSGVRIGDPTYTATVNRLTVDGLFWNGGQSPNAAVKLERGTVSHLSVSRVRAVSALTGGSIVRMVHSSCVITRLDVSGVYFEEPGGGSVSAVVTAADVAQTLTTVYLNRIYTKGIIYPLGSYNCPGVNVKGRDFKFETASALIRVNTATATVVVELAAIDTNTNALTITAGGTLRSKTGLPADCLTTGIIKSAGDMMFNTNAARACGVGPVVSEGTNWKGLFNGVNA